MRKIFAFVFFLFSIIFFLYSIRDRLHLEEYPFYLAIEKILKIAPCSAPISYNLGTFDKQFNISQEYFLSALFEAEGKWEKAVNLNLFSYEPFNKDQDVLKLNLIYDYRQEATGKLASLGIDVKNTQASYNELKNKFDTLKAEYLKERNILSAGILSFNKDKEVYQNSVDYWNKRGGAPQEVFDKLSKDKQDIEVRFQKLKTLQNQVNQMAGEINALVVVLNRLVSSLNLSVEKYNAVNVARGESFEEGIYSTDGVERKIDVYEFSNRDKLVRVLVHEFGHALGLEHSDDPKAIMYKLNVGETKDLSVNDITALKSKCAINP